MREFPRRVVLVSLLATVVACGPQIVVRMRDGERLAARSAPCDAKIYREADDVPAGFREIGSVELGDTGFSVDCSPARMLGELRRQTCLAGADAARVTKVTQADMESTCMRITATLLARRTSPND